MFAQPASHASSQRAGLVVVLAISVLILTISVIMPVYGQELTGLPGQWVTFDIDHGLPANRVFTVWVDPGGVVWAGTAAGLARFDGVEWQRSAGEVHPLTAPVHAVWGTSAQDIWVASDTGVAHYSNSQWSELPAATLGLPLSSLSVIWGNSEGELWIGGDGGVAHYDGHAWRAITPQNSSLPDGSVFALTGSPDGNTIWIGMAAGLIRCTTRSSTCEQLAPPNVDPANLWVQSLWLSGNTLWVGTWDGLLRYDIKTGQWSPLIDGRAWDGPNIVTGIWESQGQLWLTVSQSPTGLSSVEVMQIEHSRGPTGLRHFNGTTWRSHVPDGAPTTQIIYALQSNGDGVFWLATENGLVRFDDERWRAFTDVSPVGIAMNKVRGDGDGHVWFTAYDRLYGWQEGGWRTSAPQDWSSPWSGALWVDAANDVWVGSLADGAARWDGAQWEHFTVDRGLVSNAVNSIWGDSTGRVWFGTDAGLSQFDRKSDAWQTFITANSNLPSNAVTTLWGDGEALWIGTADQGAAQYLPSQNRWLTFRTEDLVDNDVRALALDPSGSLWAATARGVANYDPSRSQWQQWSVADFAAGLEDLASLTVAANGVAWLRAEDGRLTYRFAPDTRQWQEFSPGTSAAGNTWIDPEGRVWFGAQRYDPKTGERLSVTTADGLVSGDVRAVWGDRSGAVWFGTRLGVSRLADDGWRSFAEADGLGNSNVLLLAGDGAGEVWAATLGGVEHFQAGAWQHAFDWPYSAGSIPRALLAPGTGRLWSVAPDGRLYHYDEEGLREIVVADGRAAGSLQCVVEGPDGELWVGSSMGLFHRAPGASAWSPITTGGLLSNEINVIWGDGAGNVWLGSRAGVTHYSTVDESWRSFTTADGLWDNNVTDIGGDAQGNVWVASGGVTAYDGQQWTQLPGDGLSRSTIQSVWVDQPGDLWAAAARGGARWDSGRWRELPAGPSTDGPVYSLWAAADGLWIGADGTVTHFDGSRSKTYTVADGIPAGEINTIWSDGQGEAWVGSWISLAHFDGNRWQTLARQELIGDAGTLAANVPDTVLVYDIWGRNKRDVWVATNAAIVHFDGDRWQTMRPEEGLAIAGDGAAGIWVGTRRGLLHYDGNEWQTMSGVVPQRAVVWNVWRAADGSVWLATSQGGYRFGGPEPPIAFKGTSDDTWRALLTDRAGTLWFLDSNGTPNRFDQRAPGADLNLQEFAINAHALAEDANGDIWFGTDYGLLRYRPRPPATGIRSVTVSDGRPVEMAAHRITIPYRPPRVSVTVIATDTGSLSRDMSFWYRLEPRDSVWQRVEYAPPSAREREISLDGLEAGNYTLTLAVYNVNGDTTGLHQRPVLVSPVPWYVALREHPAFYWVLGAVGLLLLGAGGATVRTWQARRAYGYDDTELVIRGAEGLNYEVTWREPSRAQESYQTRLNRDVLALYLGQLVADQVTELELRQLGQLLFATMCNEVTRGRLSLATRAGHKGRRLRLNFAEASHLLRLPWEFAYGDAGMDYLGVNPDTALVRYLPPAEEVGRLKTRWPLEILVVWAEPTDLPPVGAEDEVQALNMALNPLIEKGRLHVRYVPHATLMTFTQAVSDGADIVHFIGHGDLEAGRGVLFFEDETGSSVAINDSELAAAFSGFQAFRDKAPKLVVLSACQSGAMAAGGTTLAGLAPALLHEGRVPAVVGVQFPIGAQVAASFASHFYHALVSRGGGQVDYAICVARKGLYIELGAGRRDWGAPVLYMQVTDGHIFEIR